MRRKAVLRNLIILAAILIAAGVLIYGYAQKNSLENATEKWASDNFFGEYEIFGTDTYTWGNTDEKIVYVGKTMDNGDIYEAELVMEKTNPFKWENYAHTYNYDPDTNIIFNRDVVKTDDGSYQLSNQYITTNFPELARLESGKIYADVYVSDRIIVLRTGPEEDEIIMKLAPDGKAVNMDLELPTINYKGVTGTLTHSIYISKGRKELIIEKMKAAVDTAG